MAVRMVDRLAEARRRGFVGRETELARFRDVLGGTGPARVVFVHGPGGVGKTALLQQFAWTAERAGLRVVRLDGREIPADAAAFTAVLDAGPEPADPILLLVDTFEALASLDRWLRDAFLPSLPEEWIVVLAGRDRPGPVWRTDPGWRELTEEMPLDNLSPAEGLELLRRRGVPAGQRAEALAFTRGHPLALALVADVAAQRGVRPAEAPEVVATLLKSFVDAVPTAAHRRALETCAQVMVVTEPLLAAVVGADRAGDLFEWLRGLSIVEPGPRGLFPHDLVRDVLTAETHWRDPAGWAEIRRVVADHLRERLRRATPAERQAVLLEFVYLHRDRSVLGRFLSGMPSRALDIGRYAVTAPAAGEWPLLRSWTERHEGAESAALLDLWRERAPEAFRVVRDGAGEAAGFFAVLRLEDCPRRADPAVDRALAELTGPRSLNGGETAQLVRFWMDAHQHQAPSPVQTYLTLHLSRSYLATPFLAATFLPFADPDFWAEGCARMGYRRLADGFAVGGREYGMFAHDWRREPPLAWLAALAERETGQAPEPAAALDRETFGEAVREALRGLGRAEGLRGSPLLGSRLVTARAATGEAGRTAALREAIGEAAAELEGSPRDRRAFRALHHTYLRPAETQQRAAELLGLPMTTYRRHLTAGIERITEVLWQRERDLGG